MNFNRTLLSGGALLALAGALAAGSAPSSASAAGGAPPSRPAQLSPGLPLAFEEARSGAQPWFVARSRGGSLAVSGEETRFLLRGRDGRGAAFRMRLAGARAGVEAAGLEPGPGRVNYLFGRDPRGWRTGLPLYSRVRCPEVYPGVDLVYHCGSGALEYDFVLAPGADPGRIALAFDSPAGEAPTPRPYVDSHGDLVLQTPAGELRHRRPVAYQLTNGKRVRVPCEYRLAQGNEWGNGRMGEWEKGHPLTRSPAHPHSHSPIPPFVSFELGPYDRSQPLVIDPILSFSTFLGGGSDEEALAITRDAGGATYVTGRTLSTNFPQLSPVQGPAGSRDVFLVKLDPTGSQLVYATYIGGSGDDAGFAVKTDASGAASVTGYTTSKNFPTTAGAYDASSHPGKDAFVLKLAPAGNSLVYSTRLGNGGQSHAFGLAVDGTGAAWVAGYTTSTAFPVTAGAAQPLFGGGIDAFVTKLNAAGSALLYSTYLGGSGDEGAYDSANDGMVHVGGNLALDPSGNVYVTGVTTSTNYPVRGAFQATSRGQGEGFVTKLSGGTGAIVYSTYLGGSGIDGCRSIAVDSAGSAYVAGATYSTDFPVTAGALRTTLAGGLDAFVTKLSPAGSALAYSTFLGGVGSDETRGIAVESDGSLLVTGVTASAGFPTANPVQAALAGGQDAFALRLNPTGSALSFGTFLGGAGNDTGYGIVSDGAGGMAVAGATLSANFPVLRAVQPTLAGSTDAFVLRLVPNLPAAPTGLAVTAFTNTRVDLAWTDRSTNETAFEIERQTGAGAFLPIGTVGVNQVQFSDTTAAPATAYTYRVRAVNNDGGSAYSNAVGVTTLPDPPAAPSALSAVAAAQTRVDLRWTDNSSNEDSFEVERKSGTDPFARIAVTAPNATTYADSTAAANTTYTYRVRAVNTGGVSTYAGPADATTPPNPPAVPTNLVVTIVSPTSLRLAWADNSSNETEFRIERKTGSDPFAPVITLGPDATGYTDSGLTADTTYVYRVRAANAGGASDPAEASAATPPAPPAVPADLKAQALSPTQVSVSWSAQNDADGFKLERRTGAGAYQPSGSWAATTTVYLDTSVQENTTYTYRLRAYNRGGDSDYSAEVSVTTPISPPAAPAELSATALSSFKVSLQWKDQSSNEKGFLIERRRGTDAFGQIASVKANVTKYTDGTAAGGTTYTYRVRAVNDGGRSDPSNEATVTTPVAPGKLYLSPLGVDFGTIPLGRTRTKTLKAKNTGGGPLVVTFGELAAPFGMTPGGTIVIQPKEVVPIQFTFTPTAQGAFKAKLIVTSDDPKRPTVTVSLAGKARAAQ